MVARHETGGLCRPLVMQFNSHQLQRARTKDLPGICWFFCNRVQRLDVRRRTVVPAHALRIVIVVASVPGSAQSSALRAIELYQGFVRTLQRLGKDCERRWGELYAGTMAAFADRHYSSGAGEIHRLADTCMALQFIGS